MKNPKDFLYDGDNKDEDLQDKKEDNDELQPLTSRTTRCMTSYSTMEPRKRTRMTI